MRLLTLFLTCVLSMGIHAQDSTIKQKLEEIDNAIAHSSDYVAKREARITEARNNFATARQTAAKYESALALYELYRPFVSDSAMFFLREGIRLADEMGDRSEGVRCRSLLALRCSNIGMYDEALMTLDSINLTGVSREAMGEYYRARNNVYNELGYYSRLDNMRDAYYQQAGKYEALMYETLPPDDPDCYARRELALNAKGDLKAALQLNDEWLKTVEPGSHPYALVTLYRYLEFKAQNDSVEMMRWLCESVLADVRNGVMDQGSMWELANQLMLQNDIDRAYRYISYTSDCAGRYGSRQRQWQISPLLNEIAKSYKAKSERTTNQLWLLIAAISLLFLLLLGALFFLNRRNRQLAVARNALHDTNAQLAALNDELKSANSQLSSTNGQLAVVNAQLKDANNVKDEYIGRFLALCAQYVDKLDSYRKMVTKKIKKNELADILQLSKSSEQKERDIEDLNQSFDSAFLHLFPHFVDDFNALLQPEVQIHPRDKGRLTTDLRIFALIRLGIDDSSKIAEFLHYSVNTIYNYRARIKNGAIGNREQFERRVKEIGLPE